MIDRNFFSTSKGAFIFRSGGGPEESPQLLDGIFRIIYHFLSILSLEKKIFKSVLCQHYSS